MLPSSGGQYVFVRHALGGYPGFIVGWSDWISTCGTIAFIAMVVGEYLGKLVPAAEGNGSLVAAGDHLFASRSCTGGESTWGDQGQQFLSLLKALALVGLVIACFVLGSRAAEGPQCTCRRARASRPRSFSRCRA